MADKYLNLAGTKKLYDDLRARMVESGGKVVVDAAMSETSENPVQNKVITAAIPKKAEFISDTDYGYTTGHQVSEFMNDVLNNQLGPGIEQMQTDIAGKMNKPANEGTVNQVLTKTADNYEWKDAAGGVEGLETTKARTITSADVKPEYRAQWDHLVTNDGSDPLDKNWVESTRFNFVHPEANITAIGTDGGKTIVVANDQNELSVSTDRGKSFKTVVNPYSNDKYTRILYEGGYFIALPYSTNEGGSSNTAWSKNGLSWFQGDYHDSSYHFTAPKDIIQGPDFAIGVGTAGGIMKGTINGMNFKHTGITYNGAHQSKIFYCVATAGGMWLACGEQGVIIYSTDGVTWQDFVPGAWGTNDDILFMALLNGNPYLADRAGHVKLFNLGTQPPSFNPVNTGLGNDEITYFDNVNNVLIAGTATGKIAYSKNGSEWRVSPTQFGGPIQQITFTEGTYWIVTPKRGFKCSATAESELFKFLANVNEKLTIPEKYQPLSLWTKASGTFNDWDGNIHELATIRCFQGFLNLQSSDQTFVEENLYNKAGYNLTIDNLVLDLEPTVIIGNLINDNNINRNYIPDINRIWREIDYINRTLNNKVDNSALDAVVEQVTQLLGTKADKSYVDGLIGPINTTLDEINGEVL